MRTLDEVIKALTICKNPDINRNCKDCPMPDTQECMGALMTDALHYLETWKLIVESERKARKADVPANPPLTWDELRQIDEKPVWLEVKNGERKWVLTWIHPDNVDEIYITDCYGLRGKLNQILYFRGEIKAYRKERE